MKKIIFCMLFPALVSGAFALTASDDADNYGGGWTDLSNGGSGFNPWGFTLDTDDTAEISDSTAGFAGNINTSAGSFRIASNNGESLDVFRSFGGSASLQANDVFSFDVALNNRNGNKGFDLRSGGTGVFNFNVGGPDQYFFGGVELSDPSGENWQYVADAIYSFEFSFVTETIMTAKIVRTSTPFGVEEYEIPNVALSGAVDNFKFYVSGTDNDNPNNSLYFNNFAVSEVPEPSVYSLLAGAFALTWVMVRRRS